eukprot:2220206-Amphidinium_carterae.1
MESRESVLEKVRQTWNALARLGEVWKSDHEVVLTAVQHHGGATLQFAADSLRGDREIVLAAVQRDGDFLEHTTEALRADREVVLAAVRGEMPSFEYASESLRSDREVVLAAVQRIPSTLIHAADCLLEDPTFATEAKRQFHLLKITMLSGRSTVVAASYNLDTQLVLVMCRRRLGLGDGETTRELWHGSNKVPTDALVRDWPGLGPRGEISEYQLVVMR